MRLIVTTIILSVCFGCLLTQAKPAASPCDVEDKCTQTEYSAYIECVTGKSRTKRHAPCYYDYHIQEPDCQQRRALCLNACASQQCTTVCPSCANVLVNVPVPLQLSSHVQNACAQEPCFATADKSPSKPPSEQIKNITTIIKLTNLINNTNIVQIPTIINNTNINNIHLNGSTPSRLDLDTDIKKNCCIVVYKRNCNGQSCRYGRRHSCGTHCNSKIVHHQHRVHCRSSKCKEHKIYVPQPQPSCVYSSNWPYVSCDHSRKERNCHGCYDHYGYGYQSFYANRGKPDCGGCYDDGHDQGPLYRHGPYYQPGYYHQPPMFGIIYQPVLYPPVYQMYLDQQVHQRQYYYQKKWATSVYEEEGYDDYDYYDDQELNYLPESKCKIISANGSRLDCNVSNNLQNSYLKHSVDLENEHIHVHATDSAPHLRRTSESTHSIQRRHGNNPLYISNPEPNIEGRVIAHNPNK